MIAFLAVRAARIKSRGASGVRGHGGRRVALLATFAIFWSASAISPRPRVGHMRFCGFDPEQILPLAEGCEGQGALRNKSRDTVRTRVGIRFQSGAV